MAKKFQPEMKILTVTNWTWHLAHVCILKVPEVWTFEKVKHSYPRYINVITKALMLLKAGDNTDQAIKVHRCLSLSSIMSTGNTLSHRVPECGHFESSSNG